MDFQIEQNEIERVLKHYFLSVEPYVLKSFPAKEKRKFIVLSFLSKLFEAGKFYTEQEINVLIEPVFHDFVTIRRYLVNYRFLHREPDGSKYWLAEKPIEV